MAATNRKKKSLDEVDSNPVVDVKNPEFWAWFDTIEKDLDIREITMRKTLEYLDTLPGPITIVETGCARKPESWQEGSSTLIWDRYVQHREIGSHVYSVDIDPESINACQPHLSDRVTLIQDHSVRYLYSLKLPKVDLLYLDSFDVDWEYWQPSASHHLKELTAARHLLRPETMVLIDDSPGAFTLLNNMDTTFSVYGVGKVSGKGRYVSDFASEVGAKMMFHRYQIAYTGLSAG